VEHPAYDSDSARRITREQPSPKARRDTLALSKSKSTSLHSSHANVAKAVGSPQRPQTGLPTIGSASKQVEQSTSLAAHSRRNAGGESHSTKKALRVRASLSEHDAEFSLTVA